MEMGNIISESRLIKGGADPNNAQRENIWPGQLQIVPQSMVGLL